MKIQYKGTPDELEYIVRMLISMNQSKHRELD